jgi:hypothetical protein
LRRRAIDALEENSTMIGALIKLVLIVVVLAAVAAFFFGYRFADGPAATVSRPDGVTVPVPSIDTEKARQTGAAIGEAVATGADKAQRALSDGALTAKIKSKMALDDTVKALEIDVDTVAGAVTLSGTVHSEAERTKAMQLARETAGVTSVTDRLVIK